MGSGEAVENAAKAGGFWDFWITHPEWIISVLVAIIGAYAIIKSAIRESHDGSVRRLKDNLESFYYPFLLLAKKTTQIYQALIEIVPFSLESDSDGCIANLLNGNSFEDDALVLFDEILKNDRIINNLILNNAHVVSNYELRDELSELSAHYTILDLVATKHLVEKEHVEIYKSFQFQSSIVDHVENEVAIIEEKIHKLE